MKKFLNQRKIFEDNLQILNVFSFLNKVKYRFDKSGYVGLVGILICGSAGTTQKAHETTNFLQQPLLVQLLS